MRGFDTARFEEYVARARAGGVSFTTMAALGDGPAGRRALYELNKECSADIPARGEFHTFDAYTRLRLEVPSYDPRGGGSSSRSTATSGSGWPRRRTTGRRDSSSTR